MRRSHHLAALLISLFFVLVVLPATGQAAPIWHPAANGVSASATSHRIEYDGSGNAIAVWTKRTASGDSVWTATAPVGSEVFGPVSRLSPAPAAGDTPVATDLALAVDDDGDAVAAWTSAPAAGGLTSVVVAVRDGGTWVAPQTVSDGAYAASRPAASFAAKGTALVAWQQGTADYSQIRLVSVLTAAASVAPVQSIAPSSAQAGAPQLATDGQGNSVLAWTETAVSFSPPYTGASTLRAMTRKAAAATFTGSQQVYSTRTATIVQPAAAMDRYGNATIAWGTNSSTDGSPLGVYAATKLSSASTWPGLMLSDATGASPDVSASTIGGAVVTWVERPAGSTQPAGVGVVKAARRGFGATAFTAPAALTGAGAQGFAPDAASGTGGQAIVAWIGHSASGDAAQAAVLAPATNSWWASQQLDAVSPSLGAPAVAVDATGNAFALWQPGAAGASQRTARLDGSSVTAAPLPADSPAVSPDPAPTTPAPSVPVPTTPAGPGAPSAPAPSAPPVPSVPAAPAVSPIPSSVATKVTVSGPASGSGSGAVSAVARPHVMEAAGLGLVPSLRSFKALSARRFPAAGSGEGLVARGSGFTFGATTNVGGTLRMVVTSAPKGGRAKNLKPALTAPLVAGTTRLVFTGRLAGRALPAGTYRLKADVLDASGQVSNRRLLTVAIR